MTADSLIAVDLGNSFLHAAVFRSTDAQESPAMVGPPLRPDNLADLAVLPQGACRWFISSVHRGRLESLRQWVSVTRPEAIAHVLRPDEMPIARALERPDQVGVDRLAAAVAANELRDPDRAAIVVDVGTATTVDLVDRSGVFRGGVILPSARICSLALAEYTDALPVVPVPTAPPTAVGNHTEAAIASGLFWGSLGAVRECVDRIRDESGGAELFLTGGGAITWAPYLDDARDAGPLTLIGIAMAGRRLIESQP